MNREALFPGSFDPFTLGHKAIVDQGLELFDRIVVGVGSNMDKRGMLSLESRVRLIKDIYQDNPRVEVVDYDGLTGDCCRALGLKFILRGLRNTVDYEYERNVMLVNQMLFPEIKTVLLFTPTEFVAISSTVVRELIHYGSDPSELLPKEIDIKNYL